MSTTIQISDKVKTVLDRMKMIERETYNDIIERMLEDDLELNEQTKKDIEEARKRSIYYLSPYETETNCK